MGNKNKKEQLHIGPVENLLLPAPRDISPEDYSVIEKWKPIWRLIADVCQSAVFVFDCLTKKFMYVSGVGLSPFGLEAEVLLAGGRDPLLPLLHPEEVSTVLLIRKKVYKFLHTLPAAEVKDYKMVHEFRLRKTDGKYARMTEQEHVIALREDGHIWLTLSVLNIDAGNESEPVKSHVYKLTTGEEFHIDLADTLVESLTPREKEVLLLIRDGLLSKEISARLGISVHTVSVHRQHIFNKLGCDNAMEAVKRASTLGLLP